MQQKTKGNATQQLMDEALELQQDYGDFECDEVIAACTAIADRQKRNDELNKNVIVSVQDVANEKVTRNFDPNASKNILVKARIM